MLSTEVGECRKRLFVIIAIECVKISFLRKCHLFEGITLPQKVVTFGEMPEVELLLNGAVFRVPSLALRQVCTKFATNPLPAQYPVRSQVSSELLEKFQSALEGEAIEVTKANFKELSALCDEFGFELKSPLYRLARLETAVEELRNDIGRLSGEVSELRSAAVGMQSLPGMFLL
jgi:hypothetical protein